jgi:hypothetical protein
MLLFTKIMAQATSAYLRKGVDSLAWSAGHTSDLMIQCEKLALAAAEEVVDSAKALNDFHVFKASHYINSSSELYTFPH